MIEKATDSTGTVLRITATNVSASLGDGTQSFVNLAGGSGMLVLSGGNLAGQIAGNVTVTIPGITLTGSLQLSVNTSNAVGGFTDSLTFGTQPSGTTAIVVGDVNGDGRPDLIVATSSGQKLLYLNDGNPDPYNTLSPIQIGGTSADHTLALALADVAGDNHQDLIVGNQGSANELYLNDGQGNFTLASPSGIGNLGSGATAIAVGDLNGDGHPDLVLANGGTPTVFLNRGPDTTGHWQGFSTGTAVSGAAATATALGLADFNLDGALDLVVANSGANALYLGDGHGGLIATAISLGSGGTALSVGDLNGDGYPDLVIATASGASVVLNGAGAFTTRLAGPLTAGATTVAVTSLADFPTGGGTIKIGSETVTYTGVNVGTGTLTLTAGTSLASNHPQSDLVVLVPPALTLGSAVTTDPTLNSLTVSSVTGLPTAGTVLIDAEQFTYTGVNAQSNLLTGVVRGANGTTAAAHTSGASVIVVLATPSLAAPLTAGATSLTVTSVADFPSGGGTILIDAEQITYTGVSGLTLTGLGRGAGGTTAAAHTQAAPVTFVPPTMALGSSLTATATTLTLSTSAPSLPAAGTLLIGTEQIVYTGDQRQLADRPHPRRRRHHRGEPRQRAPRSSCSPAGAA